MDFESSSSPLERSVSQQSVSSVRSARSSTVRGLSKPRKLSHTASYASSIAASDKSLTSFPSLSPESPHAERTSLFGTREDRGCREDREDTPTTATSGSNNLLGDSKRGLPDPPNSGRSMVDDLVVTSPTMSRSALFDEPLPTQKVPGALHLASDAHISRLITRHGAVELVRRVASDLATRDAQIAGLRRRAEERERALRKIILECGLSNMDMETRLRSIENEMRSNGGGVRRRATDDEGRLSDLMSDAMEGSMTYGFGEDRTVRATSLSLGGNGSGNGNGNGNGERGRLRDDLKGTSRGWKDFLWGGGGTSKTNSKVSSRASSVGGDAPKPPTVVRSQTGEERRPRLADDLFTPPETASIRSSSRASSVSVNAPGSGQGLAGRKASLASMALRLVVGGSVTREGEGDRGRANSVDHSQANSIRVPSNASARTTQSARTASTQGGPKALMAMRRGAAATSAASTARANPQERWDTMVGSPPSNMSARQESYGPVEMDTILPPDVQPPTLSHTYNNYGGTGEYLTDRFGFIYDQRRKKKQKEAAQMSRYIKNRAEMLTNGRSSMSPVEDESTGPKWEKEDDSRPESPSSLEERNEEGKTKRWQDYLKIATFPTELLSHMPIISAPSLEVLEGGEELPKSPGLITSDDRGFVPMARTTATVDSEVTAAQAETDAGAMTLAREDAEPVKMLLQQLSDVHDSFQREKTMRWNEFLRKVRAERRREGEAAAAAAAAVAEARFERPAVILPEAKLADGEMIGISGLGNKGKVGRAKWNEFKNLVCGGIPVAYRNKVWSECSGASSLRVPGYYDDLVSKPTSDNDAAVVAQIQMDISRTLTDNIFFRKGPGVAKLNEVLLAYARRNPEVGYCQGMNLITANLLLITPSAEDAFWILASIIENILPRGYYDHSLLSSRADQQVLRRYVGEVLPKLNAHLDDLGVELEALTFQWFLSVFTDCLSAEALFRVWDVVLCCGEGSTFLFRVALALLKLNEAELLGCSTPAAVYTYIGHRLTNHAISIDGLIQASEALRRVVRKEDVEKRREEAVRGEEEVTREREERNSLRREAIKAKKDAASVKSREMDAASTKGKETSPGTSSPPAADASTAAQAEETTTASTDHKENIPPGSKTQHDEPAEEAGQPGAG